MEKDLARPWLPLSLAFEILSKLSLQFLHEIRPLDALPGLLSRPHMALALLGAHFFQSGKPYLDPTNRIRFRNPFV
jgi:hypothetical protein